MVEKNECCVLQAKPANRCQARLYDYISFLTLCEYLCEVDTSLSLIGAEHHNIPFYILT